MKIDYYGHSCFAVNLPEARLLFDPFISPNPLAGHVDVDQIKADYILLSHGHEDHVADAVRIAKNNDATVIAAFEVASWVNRQGVQKVQPMNHGGAAAFDFGRVKFVQAIHSSSLPDGTYGGNPGGFVIASSKGSFYYSGDTALHYDMRLIGEKGGLDWAALCIGDHFTMGVEDAETAASFVGVKKVLGVHYDTFPPIEIDHAHAKDYFSKKGRQLHLVEVGGAVDL